MLTRGWVNKYDDVDPIVNYLCPACGNPYFGSSIASYTVFHIFKFSDGSSRSEVPSKLWLTRCPRCRRFFAKEHLFEFPMTSRVAEFIRYDRQREYDNKQARTKVNNRENQKLYGNVDYTLRENENVIDFLEQAVEVGLYFPVNVSDSRKEELRIALHRTLWWEYNQNRDKITNEKYNALCEKLIKLLISTKCIIREKELMLAELYRNIGSFEESFKQLKSVRINPDNLAHVNCIREQIKQKNNRIVIVEQN